MKGLLKKYNIKPKKSLGQNFLTSQKIVEKIINVSSLKKDDVVLEIGPGLGILTKKLAQEVKKVITIEKDEKICEILKEELKGLNNIEIINQDILKTTNYQLPTANYKVVANLPFNIASAIIRIFLEANPQPNEMILMVQKEVAQRICAKPPDMNILAISVQLYARPEIAFFVSKKLFSPKPKVDAAILKISKINQKRNVDFNKYFFEIVKAGFSHPRKQIINNFEKSLNLNKDTIELWLKKNNLNPKQRAETLSVQDWINLTRSRQ